MLRRTTWLSTTATGARAGQLHGAPRPAEEFHGTLRAPLQRPAPSRASTSLARWTFPLLEQDGILVALKGERGRARSWTERACTPEPNGHGGGRHPHLWGGLLEVPTVTMELTVRPWAPRFGPKEDTARS